MKITEYAYENHIICPFCDKAVGDEWEFIGNQEDGYRQCYNCDKIFLYEVHKSVSYSSYPLDLDYYISTINRNISTYYWIFNQQNVNNIKQKIISDGEDSILQISFTQIGLTIDDIELGSNSDAVNCGKLTNSGINKVKSFYYACIMKSNDD